jgi:internalin A
MTKSELLQKIQQAAQEKAMVLDLGSQGLTELPPELGQLTHLRELFLSDNQLTQLPPELGQLTQLRELSLNRNQLTQLPPELGQLTQLQWLVLSVNQLTQLPPELGQLTQLQRLNLFNNQLTQLPPELGQLTQLRELYLSNNQLTQLPPELGQLTQLRELDLSDNQLTQLPPELGQLTQLQELYLSNNQLTQLPPELGQLTQLQGLNLRRNRLTELPPVFDSLAKTIEANLNNLPTEEKEKGLKYGRLGLHLEDNPFRVPIPPEILEKVKRPTDIIDYFKALQAGSRPLHEAKMLLVGQGGVGKTSLVKRLLHNTYNDHETKTEGIAIDKWSVPTPANDRIHLHIWDFGGQEIMHATHQFFLTERSLYLLVLDARQGEQESRVEYWLKLIQSFGGESPILVAINKTDEHPLDINRKGLQSKYPTIQAFFDISCKTGVGLDDLKQQIQDCLNHHLPHVHDLFPKNWFGVKNTLGKMQEDYLSYDEYLKMCRQEGITDETSQRTLIGILHDLGIVLNFRDDPLRPQLADTNILNPEWVTQGVYTLLNSRTLKDTQGVLEVSQLKELLDSSRYPQHKQYMIVQIMEKFELCFAIEQGQRFLIPELLPKDEPELTAWGEKQKNQSLRFEYHYDVLPSSVISRFIVRLHEKILDKTYWRTGVVLTDDHNQALVKADIEDKKIFIWVTGNDYSKRVLLGIIRSQLEHIHQSISKIQVTEQVPYKGIVIPYSDLLKLERKGYKKHFVPAVDEEVDVVKLLDGIGAERRAIEEGIILLTEFTQKEFKAQKYTNMVMITYFVLATLVFGMLLMFRYGWDVIKPLLYFLAIAGGLGLSMFQILKLIIRDRLPKTREVDHLKG